MNTTRAFASKAGVTLASAILGASAFAGLLYEPGNYAAQDHLVLQLDGIRNAGALKAHDGAATAWVDLKSDGRSAAISTISSISGRSVPATSLQEGTAGWTDDGYYFDGVTIMQMSGALTLGNTYTIQVVCDVDTDKFQTRFTQSSGVVSEGTLQYPGFIGTTDTDGNDYCNIYYNCGNGHQRVNAKMGKTNFDPVFVTKAAWNNRYLTAWSSGSEVSLFDGKAVGTKTSKNLAVGKRTLTFGASYGSTTYGAWRRSLVGTIKAVRIYDAALSDEQLAANRALDDARFFNGIPVTNVVVAANIDGVEANEGCGAYAFDAEGYTFTAPAQVTNGNGIFECTGYTLQTWNGSAWGSPVSHDGELSCTLSDTSAKVLLTWQWNQTQSIATYTWMASPANATWDASSLNWNSGEAWADGNDAVFPATSSQKKITLPAKRTARNVTFDGASYALSGSLAATGKITANANPITLAYCLAGETATIGGSGMVYMGWEGTRTLKTLTLEDSVTIAPNHAYVFGQPSSFTTNIVVSGSGPTIFFNNAATAANALGSTRFIRLVSGSTLHLGAGGTFTLNNLAADSSPGLDFSTDTIVDVPNAYSGLIVLNPTVGTTNAIGRLSVKGRAKVTGGGTRLGAPSLATGAGALLYVNGNSSAFADTKGNLVVDGGVLYASQDNRYVEVSNYGQVTVTGGGRIDMPGTEWLNGLTNPGRLTVTNGEFNVATLRLSQSGTAKASEINLNKGGVIRASTLRMDTSSKAVFAFNGGAFQSTSGGDGRNLFTSDAARWANVAFTVGEKGAVLDASNGVNIWWDRPLASGAESDGGLRKLGSGILILRAASTYNGPTVLESGRIQARVDHAIPSGTTLRLGGGDDCKFTAYTYDSENPQRDTVQTIARVEGSGALDNMARSSVGGVAPSAGGTIEFQTTCALSGDYEVSADSNGCSCLKVAAGQDISGLAVKVLNAEALDKDVAYKILDAAKGYAGKFGASVLPEGWTLKYEDDGVSLKHSKGMLIILR